MRTGIFIALAFVATGVFIFSGLYPMGADTPHFRVTTWALEILRERSIARASSEIKAPTDLDSADRLLSGGADYNDMCAGCHLSPGVESSDLSRGLYPAPPNLTNHAHVKLDSSVTLARSFWIIKHGVKMSGMPAWGMGHDDERIWNMVAFLERLPDLNPVQYQSLTARAPMQSEETH